MAELVTRVAPAGRGAGTAAARDWKRDRERGAAVGDARDRHHAAVSFHDALHHREAEARAALGRGGVEEWLEDAPMQGLGNATTGVRDGDGEPARHAVGAHPAGQHARFLRFQHGVMCVDEQVGDGLPELFPIAEHRGQRLGHLHGDGDPVGLKRGREGLDGIAQQSRHVDFVLLPGLAARHHQEVANHGRAALRGVHHLLRALLERSAFDGLHEQVDLTQQDAERVVQLVGDVAEESGEGGAPVPVLARACDQSPDTGTMDRGGEIVGAVGVVVRSVAQAAQDPLVRGARDDDDRHVRGAADDRRDDGLGVAGRVEVDHHGVDGAGAHPLEGSVGMRAGDLEGRVANESVREATVRPGRRLDDEDASWSHDASTLPSGPPPAARKTLHGHVDVVRWRVRRRRRLGVAGGVAGSGFRRGRGGLGGTWFPWRRRAPAASRRPPLASIAVGLDLRRAGNLHRGHHFSLKAGRIMRGTEVGSGSPLMTRASAFTAASLAS